MIVGIAFGTCHLVSFIGDVFAIALGFYRVPFWKCSFYMLIGRGLRFLLWTLLLSNMAKL